MNLIIFLTILLTNEPTFCDGWTDGYKAGYCYERQFCGEPSFIPNCPWPTAKEDNYNSGYAKGFKKGKR